MYKPPESQVLRVGDKLLLTNGRSLTVASVNHPADDIVTINGLHSFTRRGKSLTADSPDVKLVERDSSRPGEYDKIKVFSLTGGALSSGMDAACIAFPPVTPYNAATRTGYNLGLESLASSPEQAVEESMQPGAPHGYVLAVWTYLGKPSAAIELARVRRNPYEYGAQLNYMRSLL